MQNESSEAIESYCRNICVNEKIKLFVGFVSCGKNIVHKISICMLQVT